MTKNGNIISSHYFEVVLGRMTAYFNIQHSTFDIRQN